MNIKKKYGRMSSWAIWEKPNTEKLTSNIKKIGFFNNPTLELLSMLNPNIIIVGLNLSGKLKSDFINFHSNKNDGKLRYFQDTIFKGCYMTDIIKNHVESKSKNIKLTKEEEEKHIKFFEQELIDIGSDNPTIIALGNKSFQILTKYLGNKYKIYKVYHTASREMNEKKASDASFGQKLMFGRTGWRRVTTSWSSSKCVHIACKAGALATREKFAQGAQSAPSVLAAS